MMGHRIKPLDGVRGLAILFVIAFHTFNTALSVSPGELHFGFLPRLLIGFCGSMWSGVDLFFVLSGFLITGILMDSQRGEGYFRNFYVRRALRIFPLYYVVLITVLWIVPAVVGLGRLPALYSHLLANQAWLWVYLQNYIQAKGPHTLPGMGHFWSLAIEEQFYWIWPFVVYFCTRRTLFRICIAICAGVPLLRLVLFLNGVQPWALRHYTFTRFDTLVFGAIAAILVREELPALWWRRFAWFLNAVAVLFIAIEVLRTGFVPFEGVATVIGGYSAVAVLFASLIYYCAKGDGILQSMLSAGPLRWFGKYSYAIYILHPPIDLYYHASIQPRIHTTSLALSFLCSFGFVMAIACAGAQLSWYLVESPFLKLKSHFEYRPDVPIPSEDALLSPTIVQKKAASASSSLS